MHLTSDEHAAAAQLRSPGYRHEAVFWSHEREFVGSSSDFVMAGLEAGERVMVATVPPRLVALHSALGTAAADVEFADMTDMGANPNRIIAAWLDFLERCDGRPARGIGEPIWVGRSGVELEECQLHEALLNLAVPAETPFWLRCPYDVHLGEDVLAEAVRTHPTIGHADGTSGPAAHFGGEAYALHAFSAPLPDPPPGAVVRLFGESGIRRLRDFVEGAALGCCVSQERAADLALAVHEVAANSVSHGGGHGELALWRDGQALVCEVRDPGYCSDPLVGRRPVAEDQARGRGLWMVNQLCDLVQFRSGEQGTTVRLYTWL